MRKAFTLIEILVVMVMMSFLMMMIAPSGLKIIDSIENFLETKEDEKDFQKIQVNAFISATDINSSSEPIMKKFNVEFISLKGIIHKKQEILYEDE